jgi:UDP-2,3-diacylglucosamine pyrophosphatase LpxH
MAGKDSFELVIIGDAGSPCLDREDPVLRMLKQQVPSDPESAVIFLGDNIYPRGLPPENHPLRKVSEKRLLAQLEAVKDYKGRLVFISGNHDWNLGKRNGYTYVLRQEEYIRKYFNGRDVFLPRGGCPGPVEVNVNDYFTIIVINTQWWVQSGFRPAGKECGCTVNNEEEFFWDLYKILDRNKGKRVLIVGHMPVYSYGAHGGRYLLRHHIFPLTMFRKKLFVPLPGLGSLVALYRRFIGIKEDLAHPRYRRFRVQLKNVMRNFSDVMYAAGHEHNLQYIRRNGNHFIVSGAGSKVQFLRPGKNSLFGSAHKGFFKLRVNADMSVDSEVWQVDLGGEPVLAFKKRMIEAAPQAMGGTMTIRAEGST